MECLTAADFQRYNSESLSPTERRRVEAHLDQCPRCRTAHKHYRSNEAFLAAARPTMKETSKGNSVPPAATDEPDQRAHYPHIQGYEIIGVAGRGGMGIVYEAIQTALGRKVALKVLPAILGTASPDAVARFRREATAAAKLHHTNIIPIYDYGQSRDGYYYGMELIDGEPLNRVIGKLATVDITEASAARIAEILVGSAHLDTCGTDFPVGQMTDWKVGPTGTMPERSAGMAPDGSTTKETHAEPSGSSMRRGRIYFQHVARWMADVAAALDYAHRQGIIHRDIKPSNLILSRDGRLMIADFGLARASKEKSITMTGSLVGTLRYMSPEQAMAKRLRLDHRTDIYSLGVTMYELLTFQPAFHGRDEKEILSQVITRDPTAPKKLNPSVPRDLDTICLKCVEKSPAARFDTAHDLAAELQRYIDDVPIFIRPPGLLSRSIKFVKRHRTKSVAVLAVLLLVLVGSFALNQMQTKREERAGRMQAETKGVQEQVERLKTEATRSVREEQWDMADAQLVAAQELDPGNARAMFMRAWSRQRQAHSLDEPEAQALLLDADALCREARALDPPDYWGLNIHGVVLKKLKRYAEAIGACKESAAVNPDYFAAWVNLGSLHALQKDFPASRTSFKRAAELAGSATEEKAVESWRNFASLLLHLSDSDALVNINKALEWKGQDPATYSLSARIRLELDGALDPRLALEHAQVAYHLTRERPDPRVTRIRALAHLRSGEFDQAIKHAKQAIALKDMATINHLVIAIAHARRGQVSAAREHLQTALDGWPGDLKKQGVIVMLPGGLVWFETAEELNHLQREAQEAIGSQSP